MRKLLPLIILLLFTVSCAAQKTEEPPVYVVTATVTDIISDRALISAGRYSNYNIPKDLPVDNIYLEVGKTLTFWLEIVDRGDRPTKTAMVVAVAYTCDQAQKDQEAVKKKLSHRKIIK